MTAPSDNLIKLYDAYMPELIEITIWTYECERNFNRPQYAQEYRVNRERYDDAFWMSVVEEHIKYSCSPLQTIPAARRQCGGPVPWPNLIRRYPFILSGNSRLIQSVDPDPFSFTFYLDSCTTEKKLVETVEYWQNRKPEVLANRLESRFLLKLLKKDWDCLVSTTEGRMLTGEVLLKAMEADGMEKFEKIAGRYLPELIDQLQPPLPKP